MEKGHASFLLLFNDYCMMIVLIGEEDDDKLRRMLGAMLCGVYFVLMLIMNHVQ